MKETPILATPAMDGIDGMDTMDEMERDALRVREVVRGLERVHEELQGRVVPVRPLFFVRDRALEFERVMRMPPRWRCSGCGWLDPRDWRESYTREQAHTVKVCPECGEGYVQRYQGPPIKWPPLVEGPERTWALAVAKRLKVELARVDDTEAQERVRCRQCGSGCVETVQKLSDGRRVPGRTMGTWVGREEEPGAGAPAIDDRG